ncbi:hypothetical protein H0H81_010347, partial [Sphagnurus paluster]
VIHVALYTVEHRTLNQLLDTLKQDSYLAPPKDITLWLEISPKKQQKGGFKLCSFGVASQPLFNLENSHQTNQICAKQTYYEKTGTVEQLGGDPIQVTQNIPHDGQTQAQHLTMEVKCLVWVRVLMNLVYQFIDKEIESRGAPPFKIPQFHFVDAALAVEHSGRQRVFLLEEVIRGPHSLEGPFKKYMNNVSAEPLQQSDVDDEEHGLFLAFSQHVQYFKTKKMVFVSDYQVVSCMLYISF